MKKECKDVGDHLGDYINDKLTKEQRIRVMEHLLICTECRDSVKALTTFRNIVKGHEFPIPEGAIDRIVEESRFRKKRAEINGTTESRCVRIRNFLKRHLPF